MTYAIIIPARRDSSRLPGKPLIELGGVPMIVRTYQQCAKAAPAEQILVATDCDVIQRTCEQAGIRTLMTSSDCLTGTDRVAEVAQQLDVDTYINVQGDDPLFNPQDVRLLIDAAVAAPNDVINGYCPVANIDEFRNPSVPKVIVRPDGRLLYMSRASIPITKQGEFRHAWRQVCAYAFPKQALRAFASVSCKTTLEEIEDIEILRFLELGFEVRMVQMSDKSIAVDTPADVQRVEQALRAQSLADTPEEQ
ncbi:3-deoxy-manno-octulosonate cytidylyltransferase [Xanthomonas arboricola]|uniref:3-deoxy-manno-octulosonate cytidylyltransferase n=1 Tax=Xanthomonas arboricola TaxID=56448 RepID=UPI0004D96206|nr:3-deoxy-manno-octulosonate cytidylyltransferase [Xanthomonas arboricola]KER83703.1 3-deoxy-manno-octulosonate cytidylyltransferase [Xanthomonas arboricola pv. celebensis]MBB6573985.1 3-deoxy-manno-octulosonate cytidylyltransferase (CMP-KDO synthetase) [Xanthomonas arboricola]PPT89283.1 3-deoxy-manno-octulosonate cytidylyltransferase [Xanthomonas arboricola]PPU25983.1 3-deoxy-manno-octulosonate cytidylyltransferase [Xanthomonas arboricola]SOU00867.1 CMP-2-keto-3-deoxyoctulosonic acid synthet